MANLQQFLRNLNTLGEERDPVRSLWRNVLIVALEDALGKKKSIAMLQSAFDHPVSGDWEWHTLFGAMAGMIPSISDDLGMLTRSAFPMHLLEGEKIFETVHDIHAKGKYTQMIDLMSQACPEMMESVVVQFHLSLN